MPLNIEIWLANFSFFTLFISMIFYWIETSQFEKKSKKAQTEFLNGNVLKINDNLALNDFSFFKNNNFWTNLIIISVIIL